MVNRRPRPRWPISLQRARRRRAIWLRCPAGKGCRQLDNGQHLKEAVHYVELFLVARGRYRGEAHGLLAGLTRSQGAAIGTVPEVFVIASTEHTKAKVQVLHIAWAGIADGDRL